MTVWAITGLGLEQELAFFGKTEFKFNLNLTYLSHPASAPHPESSTPLKVVALVSVLILSAGVPFLYTVLRILFNI